MHEEILAHTNLGKKGWIQMSMSNPKVKEKQRCITVLNVPNPSLSCSCVGCRALCNAGARRPITKQRVKAKIRSIDLIIVFSCVFFLFVVVLLSFQEARYEKVVLLE